MSLVLIETTISVESPSKYITPYSHVESFTVKSLILIRFSVPPDKFAIIPQYFPEFPLICKSEYSINPLIWESVIRPPECTFVFLDFMPLNYAFDILIFLSKSNRPDD